MDEYINKSVAIKKLQEVKDNLRKLEKYYITEEVIDYMIDRLLKVSASDVAPVVHGRWEKSTIPEEKFVCSNCGGACWYYDYQGEVAKSRYCPNCGTKMDME